MNAVLSDTRVPFGQLQQVRLVVVAVTVCLVLSSCCVAVAPTPGATALPSSTATLTVTGAPTRTAIETPRTTSSPTLAPSGTPTATPTFAPSATSSASPVPTATRTLTPAYRLNASGWVGLGAHMDGMPYDRFLGAQQFEGLIRHKLEYVLWFQAWGESDNAFLTEPVRLAAQMGFTPVITWEPWKRNFANPTELQPAYSLASIEAGEHDAYIRGWARAARAAGVPLVLRFAHEQSTEPGTRPWYPWQGDPEGYRGAYRHVVELFRAENARNVQFLWSAMWLNQWAAQYYPGSDVVDMVGTTVLNHGTAATADWARWRTFDELFQGQYEAALQWGKPILVTELATAEQGGNKADWLRACLVSLRSGYPLVRGLLLLEVPSDREYPTINWSVASSPQSLATFREIIRDGYFR